MNPQNHKPDFENTPPVKLSQNPACSQNPAGSQNPAHDGADTRGASPTTISAKESSERCVAMDMQRNEQKSMQERERESEKRNNEKIMKETEKENETEIDKTRERETGGDNKIEKIN